MTPLRIQFFFVIPAKAGIPLPFRLKDSRRSGIDLRSSSAPAFAGMTDKVYPADARAVR
jgi:hypothetical protein